MISLINFVKTWGMDGAEAEAVHRVYPFGVSAYFQGLIREKGDPLWGQVAPDIAEIANLSGLVDPLAEEALSPVPNLVHRYPNRVLWLVHTECALHCRFCTRKRRWRTPVQNDEHTIREALRYIGGTPAVRDVLLSGGDPLLLPRDRLEFILQGLRKAKNVEVVRIGTRLPGAFPRKITRGLASMLSRYHPVYINLHFNHPSEITPEAARACGLLADAGIPLGSQTVLLKGINDSARVLGELFQGLLRLRVRPYYLMQMDLASGPAHFRTPVAAGLEILDSLRNRISGLAIPHFVIDLPGGQGKVPLVPKAIAEIGQGRMILKNYLGKSCEYPLLEGEEEGLKRWAAANR